MNPSLPYYSRYNHRWNPRKWKSIKYSQVYNPTMLHGAQIILKKGNVENGWIGKYFVPYSSKVQYVEGDNYVLEEDIAYFSGMYTYRIVFGKIIGGKFIFQSTLRIENRPKQMNILIDQYGIIYDVMYF